jgi:hypothetical protein
MIDPGTGWFEIAELKSGQANFAMDLLKQAWLTRYPWPTEVICNNGEEFMVEAIDTNKDDTNVVQKLSQSETKRQTPWSNKHTK